MTPKNPKKKKFKRLVLEDIFWQFVAWWLTPKDERDPPTQQKFAERFGVHMDTLTDWKDRPEFLSEIIKTCEVFMKQAAPAVTNSFVRDLIQGGSSISSGDRKLFYKMVGMARDEVTVHLSPHEEYIKKLRARMAENMESKKNAKRKPKGKRGRSR